MTWSDPIVDEVRRTRDAYASRFNYDLQGIFRDLKEQEKRSGRKIVLCAEVDQQLRPEHAFNMTAMPDGQLDMDTASLH